MLSPFRDFRVFRGIPDVRSLVWLVSQAFCSVLREPLSHENTRTKRGDDNFSVNSLIYFASFRVFRSSCSQKSCINYEIRKTRERIQELRPLSSVVVPLLCLFVTQW